MSDEHASGHSPTGLSPATLVHTGSKLVEQVTIDVLDYDEAGFDHYQTTRADELAGVPTDPRVTWIRVKGLHDVETISVAGEQLGIHPLLLEDILDCRQRPKLEEYPHHLAIIIKWFDWEADAGELTTRQVSVMLGDGYVVTFEEEPCPAFEQVFRRIVSGAGRIRRMEADYLTYALIDAVVDSYFTVLDDLDDRLERLEDEVLVETAPDISAEIQSMRRALIFLGGLLRPIRGAVEAFHRCDTTLVSDGMPAYTRDLRDHMYYVVDAAQTLRETVAVLTDMHLAAMANRTNEVMRVLTIIATIFIPLTFIAGIYGMNFEHMPELPLPWAYPVVLGVMAVVATAMLAYFRRKRWL